MISIKDLENIGIIKIILNLKASTGVVSFDGDKVIVNDVSYYDEIFYRCLSDHKKFKDLVSKIDDDVYRTYYEGIYELCYGDFLVGRRLINSIELDTPEFINLRSIVNYECIENIYPKYSDNLAPFVRMLDGYFNDGNYRLSIDVINLMKSYDDSFYLNVLKLIAIRMNDILKYIVDPSIYRNKVILDNYHAFERRLFFYLETGLLDEVLKISDILKDLYQDQSVIVLDVINLMISKIKNLSGNRRMIASRNESAVMGDIDSVIIGLLCENDFYRVIEIINHKYDTNRNDLVYLIYKKLADIMEFYLDRNNEFVECEMELNTVSDNSADYIMGGYTLSNIKNNTLRNIEEVNEEYLDDRINYYELYKSNLDKGDYKAALDSIRKFELRLKRLGTTARFDYIEKDLMIKIQNSTLDKKEYDEYKKYLDLADSQFNNEEYKDAIANYYNAFKYAIKRNPVELCKIARCYYSMNDIVSAIKMYEVAINEFMYPDEILFFMELLLFNKDYEKVIKYSNEYEKYYPLDNPKVHYMLSICYVNLGMYSDAIAELWVTENINNEIFNVAYELKYELDIIKRLESGEVVEPFDMSTFIDFELSEFDKDVRTRLNKYKEVISDPLSSILSSLDSDFDSLENKMIYLFSLLKIYIIDKDEENTHRLYDFISDYLENVNVSLEEKNKFTLSLKNYRNL